MDGADAMKQICSIAALFLAAALSSGGAFGAGPKARSATDPDAAQLRARHAQLASRLAHNEFGRPLALESNEAPRQVSGDVFAVIDSPFAVVSKAFASPRTWCDVLILHLNTKYCRAGVGVDADSLSVRVGRKRAQDLDDGFALQFAFALKAARPGYLAAQVTSPSGPLGSRDYRIDVQAVPLPGGKSFMRLRYSYSFGGAARLATQGYLATSGSGKVGFTRVATDDGKHGYVRGLRGAVERNTMRYYLAVESYLDSLAQPPGRQFTSRIEQWFDATEQYRRQLHEMERADYLSMKQREYARQQAVALQ
ncbi:MAG: hypothetical protein WC213_08500 [Arenimonas sp.]|jgi:hypothetical protein